MLKLKLYFKLIGQNNILKFKLNKNPSKTYKYTNESYKYQKLKAYKILIIILKLKTNEKFKGYELLQIRK